MCKKNTPGTGKTFLPVFAIGETVYVKPFPNRDDVQETIVTDYVVRTEIGTLYPDGMKVRFDKDGNALESRMIPYVEKCDILYRVQFNQGIYRAEQVFTSRQKAYESRP